MAETTAVLDSNVFDAIFDIIDVIPALFKIVVEPTYGKIARGQPVSITLYIINNTTTPGRAYPLTLSEDPLIQLYNPLNTPVGVEVAMRQTGAGIYTFNYSTSTDAAFGAYSATFHLINGTFDSTTKKHVVFTII